jgi:3-methyladenine DNA glycosylase AlkD
VLDQLRGEFQAAADPARAAQSKRYFKTGPGQYGEGDQFAGLTLPVLRGLARRYRDLSIEDAETLLHSRVHEERLLALMLLVQRYQKGDPAARDRIYRLYLANTACVNNWDLVDLSAEHIVGPQLEGESLAVLDRLAASASLWERRIAMLATAHYIKQGNPAPTLRIATALLHDRHDLIHKAVGWMLREVGKRCGDDYLTTFLAAHAATMPRTALRYAIEKLPREEQLYYLGLKKAAAAG